MEHFSKYLRINGTLSLICCTLWIFSPAEGKIISEVGDNVVLHCKNESISKFSQLTWKMNEDNLFSFTQAGAFHTFDKAHELKINMSTSEDQLYALVIEGAQTSHTGNYTCVATTVTGVWKQEWELIITEREKAENWDTLVIAVAVTVPCVCLLIFIVSFILQRGCRQHEENNIHSPSAEMEQTEDIYENCLETNVSGQRREFNQPYRSKDRPR